MVMEMGKIKALGRAQLEMKTFFLLGSALFNEKKKMNHEIKFLNRLLEQLQ